MDETSIALRTTLASYMADVASNAPSLGASNVLMRFGALSEGWRMLERLKLDSFAKQIDGPVLTTVKARDRHGRVISEGVNLASQDYLSLSNHPEIKAAAVAAIDAYGVHSAGSPALMGNTNLSVALEARMCEFLQLNTCALFPTGWGAGFGTIRALVRPTDHIVIDQFSHACLWEGARASTKSIHSFAHLSVKELESTLKRIRADDLKSGIVVVTESLFSMDADSPDIAAHQALCHRYGATLMVDVAHCLGNIGERGLGVLEEQNMVGKVDVVMGSFSKTFAANGGFVACNEPGFKLAIRFQCGPHTFTNAISPIQVAVALKALDIVQSEEGLQRRKSLMRNATHLRQGLEREGWQLLGRPSAVVPLMLGGLGRSRLVTRFALENGLVVNLIEHPAVPLKSSRLRLQVMADHELSQLDGFVNTLGKCAQLADETLGALNADRSPQDALT